MSTLGIDPSVASSGYALLDGGDVLRLGLIQTSSKDSETVRLDQLYQAVKGLVEEYKPDVVVMEDQFVGPNPQTSLYLARARGVAMLAAHHAGVPVILYAPREIKKSVTGNGNANKAAVQNSVVELYKDNMLVQRTFADGVKTSGKKKNDDISDALAIAHTHQVLKTGRHAS